MSKPKPIEQQIEAALVASADGHRCPVWISASEMVTWASASFNGARHKLTVMGEPSANLDAWIAMLPDAEWALADHLVAELTVEMVTRNAGAVSIELEILTVQER